MPILNDLIGLGMPPEQASVLSNESVSSVPSQSVSSAFTALGTNLATAAPLTALVTNVASAAAGTGVALPASAPIGAFITVRNGGANDIKVYTPVATDSINSTTGSITLTTLNKQVGIFVRVTATAWIASVATGT